MLTTRLSAIACALVATVACVTEVRAADAAQPEAAALAASESQIPNPSLLTPYKDQQPIVLVVRDARKPEVWGALKKFWNVAPVESVDPSTGEKVTRQGVFIKVPLGLNSAPSIPAENPLTAEKVMLGKKLYFDPILSANNKVSCASCHNPQLGYSDQLTTSTGIFEQKGGMNAPTVYNSGFNSLQFWNGRAASLEEQAQGPPQNPSEMHDGKGNAWFKAVERIKAKPEYVKSFAQVFGTAPTRDAIAKAIGAYERLVLTGNSVVDRADLAMRERVEEDGGGKLEPNAADYAKVLKAAIAAKDAEALSALNLEVGSEPAKVSQVAASLANGRNLFFNKARCASCHVGDNYTDNAFHNLGVGAKEGQWVSGDLGRYGAQPTGHKDAALVGAYKTPGLRQLLSTAPYMHDGSETSLEAVVDLYNRGGNLNPHLDGKMRDADAERDAAKAGKSAVIPRKLLLTADEKKDLILFMRGLQGDPVDALISAP